MYKLLKRLSVYLLSMLVVVMILIILPTEAESATYYSNGFYYSLSNGKATITECHTSVSGALVIPATINSYPVTAIGNDAFYNCTALTSVTIPDGVTSIGNRAFKNCCYLTDITIPASVTRVGLDSFLDCSRLTSVHITDLAAWCDIWFGSELVSLYSNPLCYADNLYLNGTPITDLVIPDSVTGICTYAFAGYSGLTRVTIPDGVTNVGEGAFYGCNNLISVTISDSVTTIGDEAFYSCDNLSDVTIGNGVTSIGSKVFHDTGYYKNASNWENDTLYVGNYFIAAKPSITGAYTIKANTRTIAEQAFISCTGLTSVTIPNSVIRIPSGVFHGCSSLESITIPFVGGSKKAASATYQYPFGYIFGTSSYTGGIATTQYYYGSSTSSNTYSTYYIPATLKSVTVTGGRLNYGAFYSCDNLSGVTIGNGVTSIDDCAFVGCSELASITIPDSVTSIGKSAFYHCEGLTSVIIGNGVTSIGNNAFEGCNGLTSITIPNCVTKIREQAFKDCTSLTFVTIPDSITTIEHGAFYGCSSLNYNSYNNANYLGNANNPYVALISAEADIKSCVIHNDTKMIADYAFDDCDSLTSVTISDSVTSIGKDAFYGCHNLTGVYITDLAAWCKISFSNSSSNPVSYATNLYLNNQLVTELVVPVSVTSIGDYVFAGCATLSSITIHDSITSIGKDAFYECYGLTDVYITDLAAWCKISFSNSSSNPVSYATNLYLNNQLVTELVVPDSVTHIGDYAFYDCDSLTSITLPKSVNAIGKNAFYGCGKLTHVWYGGSENDKSNITGDKPTATWHYNCCNLDSHTYDNTCDDSCNFCSYPREPHHVYDDADDVTCNVCKKTLAPAAPTTQSVTDTTVTLYATVGYEYSMDAITWQTSNVFTGLQPTTTYQFYQRVAAGTDNLASPASKPLSVETDKYVPDIPWDFTVVEITDTSVSLNQVTDCEYSIDGRNWKTSPVFTDLTPGTRYTFYQRIVENSKHYASDNAVLHITTYSKLGTITYNSNGGQDAPGVTTGKISTQTPSRSGYMFMGWALTPYTHAVYKPGDSYSYQEDIILYADWEKLCSNCGGDGEYLLKCSQCSGTGVGSSERCDLCDGKGYTYKEVACTYPECHSGKIIVSDTQINDCPICKGDGICEEPVDCSNCYGIGYLTYPCSACSGLGGWLSACSQCVSGVQKFTPEAPQAPKLQSVSCNTVVLVYYSTCEYSIDGVNWQDSNVFSNLDVNRTYLFYQRYKEATYTNHSNASPVLSVTTPKGSVLPPQPPVLQSKTFHKVILEKVDGCEYSLDGINWQTSNVFDDLHPSTSYTFYCRFAETATHSYSAASDGLTVVTEQSPLYNVVFVDWNGTVISSNTYRWGDEITVPANPTKAADNTYTYTFAGWDKEVVACAGNATYTATYIPTYINYTIVFKDWDGTVLSSKTYHYGDKVTAPANPTKAADNTYTYTFAGWDNDVVNCAGDATYTATYTPTYINYTVTFKNWDGTVLSSKTYHWGDTVEKPGDPTRAADGTYIYTFAGWDNEVVNCAGDATYTATYTCQRGGTCGENLIWTLDDAGTLTISGSGAMYNYNNDAGHYAPWYSLDGSVTNIEILDGVTSIGDFAFSSCNGLICVTISNSVTRLGDFAFYNCPNLTNITIGNSVSNIGNCAFWYCTGLINVTIPDSVTSIGAQSFQYCTGLTSATVGNGVTSIGLSAFNGCTNLVNVTIGNKVASIGHSAFEDCTRLTSITLPDSVTSISDYIFLNCSSLINITIGNNVTSIGVQAFRNCTSLASIIIPDSVSSIGWQAFDGCTGLKSVTIGSSVASVGDFTFKDCTSLTSITIPNSVTSIGAGAFSNCSSLASVTISDAITSIGNFAFSDCTSLTKLIIADGSQTITSDMVICESQLTEIEIPTSVTSIGKDAFRSCTSLTTATIPNSVTSIGDYAFSHCYNLTNVTIGDGVTSIGNYAFWYCTNLDTVIYSGTKSQWNAIGIGRDNECLTNAELRCMKCYVTFKDADGNVLTTTLYNYGDMVEIPHPPVKEADNTYTYTFAGWDKEVTTATKDVVYTATYTSTYINYTVTFKNWDGSVLSSKTYHYGDTVAKPTNPTKASDNTYFYPFAGWDKVVVPCAGNATYTATYAATYIDYTVTFKNWNGTVLSTKTYHWDDMVEKPGDPTRVADNTYTYTFAGWDKEVVNCAGNVTYTATYTPTYIDYTVTFKNWDGSVLDSDKYHYNDTVIPPANPTRPEDSTYRYTFKGWDSEIVNAIANKIYTAVYEAIKKIMEITSHVFNVQGDSIGKISTGTSADSFVSKLDQGENVEIYKGNIQVSGSTSVGTGMEAKLMDGNTVVKSYTVIVTGDTNGDGAISVTDMISIKAHLLGKSKLTGAYAEAGDTSSDDAISITDFIQLKAQILGKGNIIPN